MKPRTEVYVAGIDQNYNTVDDKEYIRRHLKGCLLTESTVVGDQPCPAFQMFPWLRMENLRYSEAGRGWFLWPGERIDRLERLENDELEYIIV